MRPAELRGANGHILATLANLAGAEGQVQISLINLSIEGGYSVPTVLAAVRRLERHGYLSRRQRSAREATLYVLNPR